MLGANFMILFFIFLFNTTINDATFVQVDCKDIVLSKYCECEYDVKYDYLIMECKSRLEGKLNRLPLYSVKGVKVINAYDNWPTISVEYQKTKDLILSQNQIESIGDLTYLDNLQFLNMSYNKIRRIDNSLTKLKELYALDLSHNLLEEIHFEDLVIDSDKKTFDPNTDQIFSKLKMLLLIDNKIKHIYNIDLVFVGMPLMNRFSMNYNLLTSIEVNGLSQQSKNVITKAKQALETNSTYLEFISAPKKYNYFFGFNNNSIASVHFNFQALLNEIFLKFKVSFLTKFLAISVLVENEKVICDCNIYTDLKFLIEQLGDLFGNETIPSSHMKNFVCYKKDSASAIKLFTLVSQNSVNMSDFCATSPELTTTYTITSAESNVSSQKSEITPTSKVNTENSNASSLKANHVAKLTIAASLMYRFLFKFMSWSIYF